MTKTKDVIGEIKFDNLTKLHVTNITLGTGFTDLFGAIINYNTFDLHLRKQDDKDLNVFYTGTLSVTDLNAGQHGWRINWEYMKADGMTDIPSKTAFHLLLGGAVYVDVEEKLITPTFIAPFGRSYL